MEIIATWQQNPNYFQQYWKDWVIYKSNRTKNIPFISALITLLGLFIYFIELPVIANNKTYGLILLFIGVVLIAWYIWYKSNWIKSMLQDSNLEADIVMVFDSNGITTKSPLSSGQAKWEIIKEIISAKKGIFLVLKKGLSIYIPAQSLQKPHNIGDIIEMYKQQTA